MPSSVRWPFPWGVAVSSKEETVITNAVRAASLPTPLSITPLTPDASLRRYFRVSLLDGRTIIAMYFDSLAVPEAVGGVNVNSFDSYSILTNFFLPHGVAVPKIYLSQEESANSPAIILLEDLGDTMLMDVLLGAKRCNRPVADLYREAIDGIVRIQSIPADSSLFAYQRVFAPELYVREMEETLDYVLKPRGITPAEERLVRDGFQHLAAELDSFPKVLVHRDYHSMNLMVDQEERIRVIDFQDALLATRSYDLVGLISDRDTDAALGDELYVSLVRYLAERLSETNGWRGARDLFDEYDRALLQRDLKVAGRFAKLVTVRGLVSYGKWIPGTLRRIGRTLERCSTSETLQRMGGVLRKYSPEIEAGYNAPLRINPERVRS